MQTFNSFQDLAAHCNGAGSVSETTVFNSESGFYSLLDKIKSFKRNERHGEGKQISSTLKNRIIQAVKELAEVPDASQRETMKGDLWMALEFYETGEQASRDAARARAVSGHSAELPYTGISVEAMKQTRAADGQMVLKNQSYAAYCEGIENCRRAGMIVNDLELPHTIAQSSIDGQPIIQVQEIGEPIAITAGGTTVTISAPPELGNMTENIQSQMSVLNSVRHEDEVKNWLRSLHAMQAEVTKAVESEQEDPSFGRKHNQNQLSVLLRRIDAMKQTVESLE